MRIFGFNIKAKREPRYASHELVRELNERYEQLAQEYSKMYKAYEAMRLKVYRDTKTNGDEIATKEQEPPREEVAAASFVPGSDPEEYFRRFGQ